MPFCSASRLQTPTPHQLHPSPRETHRQKLPCRARRFSLPRDSSLTCNPRLLISGVGHCTPGCAQPPLLNVIHQHHKLLLHLPRRSTAPSLASSRSTSPPPHLTGSSQLPASSSSPPIFSPYNIRRFPARGQLAAAEVDLDRPPNPDSRPADASDDTTAPTTSTSSAAAPASTTTGSPIPAPVPSSSSHPEPPTLPASAPSTNIESSSTPASSSSARPPAQVLGRRRRSSRNQARPDLVADPSTATVPASASASNAAFAAEGSDPPPEPHPKRRRRGRSEMTPTENGTGAPSNGVSLAQSNGSSALSPQTSPAANGTHKASLAVNGSSKSDRRPGAALQSSTYFGHDREEVTRILIQALVDMGYQSAAENVSRDSGFDLESPTVAAFRSAVLQGSWSEAEKLLDGASTPEAPGGDQGNGLVLATGTDRNMMRFWVRQQKYLELLEQRDTSRALVVLRTELTPLYQDTDKLRLLSSLLMCRSTEDLKSRASWDGAEGQSRRNLLSELSSMYNLPFNDFWR